MDELSQHDQLKFTYNSSVLKQDVDLPEAMNDRDRWRERIRDIHTGVRHDDIYIYIYMCVCVWYHA